MIIVVAALLAILSVPLTGRSLAPLAYTPIRRVWVVWASMVLQLGITLIPQFPATPGQVVHIASFALAGVFLWSNRRLPGVWVIAGGAVLNVVAIAANGGTMPASTSAWRTAGFAPPTDSFGNSSVLESARLPWLGDVFAVPASWPLSNVFSVGDVVIIIGLTYLVHRTCRTKVVPASVAASTGETTIMTIMTTVQNLLQSQQRLSGYLDELGDWLRDDAPRPSRRTAESDSRRLGELLAAQSLLSTAEEPHYVSPAKIDHSDLDEWLRDDALIH